MGTRHTMLLILVMTFATVLQGTAILQSCGGITSQDVQQGVGVASDILTVLTTVLRPAVEASSKLCDELTKETSGIRERATIECAEINDAWNHVADMSGQLQQAMSSERANGASESSKRSVDDALAKLRRAVDELKAVLANSSTVGARR